MFIKFPTKPLYFDVMKELIAVKSVLFRLYHFIFYSTFLDIALSQYHSPRRLVFPVAHVSCSTLEKFHESSGLFGKESHAKFYVAGVVNASWKQLDQLASLNVRRSWQIVQPADGPLVHLDAFLATMHAVPNFVSLDWLLLLQRVTAIWSPRIGSADNWICSALEHCACASAWCIEKP